MRPGPRRSAARRSYLILPAHRLVARPGSRIAGANTETPMPRRFPRRIFLAMTALSAAATMRWSRALAALGGGEAHEVNRVRVRPFALSAVRLRAGAALEALEVNRRYLMSLDTDRLLHMFRITAGLPSTAEPLGGWEAPDNELRGHFGGHYLSACALLAAQTGDAAVRARGEHLAAELGRCQADRH